MLTKQEMDIQSYRRFSECGQLECKVLSRATECRTSLTDLTKSGTVVTRTLQGGWGIREMPLLHRRQRKARLKVSKYNLENDYANWLPGRELPPK